MDPAGLNEAREARQKSELDLCSIRGQRAAVEQVADELRDLRAPDQLARIFEESIRRKPRHG
jgi:type II secretory pathway component PulM